MRHELRLRVHMIKYLGCRGRTLLQKILIPDLDPVTLTILVLLSDFQSDLLHVALDLLMQILAWCLKTDTGDDLWEPPSLLLNVLQPWDQELICSREMLLHPVETRHNRHLDVISVQVCNPDGVVMVDRPQLVLFELFDHLLEVSLAGVVMEKVRGWELPDDLLVLAEAGKLEDALVEELAEGGGLQKWAVDEAGVDEAEEEVGLGVFLGDADLEGQEEGLLHGVQFVGFEFLVLEVVGWGEGVNVVENSEPNRHLVGMNLLLDLLL